VKVCSNGEFPSTIGLDSQESGSPNSLHLSALQSAKAYYYSKVQIEFGKYLTYLT